MEIESVKYIVKPSCGHEYKATLKGKWCLAHGPILIQLSKEKCPDCKKKEATFLVKG